MNFECLALSNIMVAKEHLFDLPMTTRIEVPSLQACPRGPRFEMQLIVFSLA